MTNANKKITSLKRNGNRGGGGGGGGSGGDGGNDNNNNNNNNVDKSGRNFNPNGYCFSHGFKVEENHASNNCNRQCEGHDGTTTRMDIKGGKQWNKDWINGGLTE